MRYDKEQIGKIIKRERIKLNCSQGDLGKKIGIVGKQISNYENGNTTPPIDVLFRLCDVFECELGYLIGETDYSEGTRLETIITDITGITVDSMNVIKKITGTEKNCLSFGYESESYRKVLNLLICSPKFVDFIDKLEKLDRLIEKCNNTISEQKRILGEENFNEAFKIYSSNVDYLDDSDDYINTNSSKLKPEQYEAIGKIDNAINEKHEFEYLIKVARYDLHESFVRLVDSIYT